MAASTFTDIKIAEMDEAASRMRDVNSALVTVIFRLSAQAPSEWANYFNERWKQHIYMSKRRAHVTGSRLEIECLPSELESDHLPELKQIMAETNQAYAKHAQAQVREREIQANREAEAAQQLRNVKGRLKFD